MQDAEPEEPSSSAGKRSPRRIALIAGLIGVLAVGGLCGWLGLRAYQAKTIHDEYAAFIQVARQGAVNLTTIDHAEAEADVARILDSATGAFYDDFSARMKPFIDVVKKAQSTSEGTVSSAGLESVSGDEAQVLVSVKVTTTTADGAEQQPRSWRMRISVQQMGDVMKVSNVAFVP
ncbi:hypothetical protein AU194_17860 [Mycobacterium sp. GA-2829]|nr:hypothetical protein AU194_17860 [Mycobacterium sp. GA-2829]